jgi:signal recognition particle subunit SRP54
MGAMDRMRAVQDIAKNSDPSGNFKVQKQRSKRGPQETDKLKDLKKKKRQDKKKSRKRNK